MKLLVKLVALCVGLAGLPFAHALSPNLFGAIVETVTLIEDTTAGMTYVEVKVDKPLHTGVACATSKTEQTLRFVYDNQSDPVDDSSASLFLYTLLLTAKSTGKTVDFVYRDAFVSGVPMEHCVVLSAKVTG